MCTELPDSFFRMKGYAGAGWGLIQGGRVAGEPPGKPSGNRWQNRRKTSGKPPGDHWQNRWKTVGKPPGDHWQNCRKTVGKPLESRRETTGKTVGKTVGNRREKPRFWVTFASLNKGREGPGRASPTSFFGPWEGLAIGGSSPGTTDVLSHPMGLAERGFAGF